MTNTTVTYKVLPVSVICTILFFFLKAFNGTRFGKVASIQKFNAEVEESLVKYLLVKEREVIRIQIINMEICFIIHFVQYETSGSSLMKKNTSHDNTNAIFCIKLILYTCPCTLRLTISEVISSHGMKSGSSSGNPRTDLSSPHPTYSI